MVNIDNEIITLSKKILEENGRKILSETFVSKGDKNSFSYGTVSINHNKMFIEFEIQDYDISTNTPKLTRETVYINSKKYKEFKTQEIGGSLKEIVNNYDKYIKMIFQCIDKLYEAKEDWRNKSKFIKNKYKKSYLEERKQLDIKLNNTCTAILKLLLYKLLEKNPKLFILENYIGKYVQDFYNVDFPNTIKDLKERIERQQNKLAKLQEINSNKSSYDIEREQRIIKNLNHNIIELKRKDSISYIFNNIIRFFSKLANELKRAKELIDNSFIYNGESKNKKFSGIESNLPNVKIEYKLDDCKFPKPFKYLYEISTIEELFSTTIYQLSLNHRVLIKCKHCGKYFIPHLELDERTGKTKRIRSDKLYCSKKCREVHTKSQADDVSNSYEHYRKLYKRYKNKVYPTEIFEELQNIYNNYYKIDDETFMKMLTDFEETVKTTHNLKRGRPKKNKNV